MGKDPPGQMIAVITDQPERDGLTLRLAGMEIRDAILLIEQGRCSVVLIARSPLPDGLLDTFLAHDTGAMNVERTRIGDETILINRWCDGSKPFGGGAGHAYAGTQVQGRWPPNVLMAPDNGVDLGLDGSGKPASRFFECQNVPMWLADLVGPQGRVLDARRTAPS